MRAVSLLRFAGVAASPLPGFAGVAASPLFGFAGVAASYVARIALMERQSS